MKRNSLIIALLLAQWINTWAQPWNLPHQLNPQHSTYYSSITAIPKTFDPAKSYDNVEAAIISQIYEPICQYHYLKRPYTLTPLTAATLPEITFYDKAGHRVSAESNAIAKTVYDITLRSGTYYQPHPAFATDKQGNPLYLKLTPKQLIHIRSISDFSETGTKELTAADYVYEIKRLASPQVGSPIFGVMAKHIVGFSAFANTLANYLDQHPNTHFLNLSHFPLNGAEVISRYHYRITLSGKYLQFKYWLAMNFFAPIPEIVDEFYSQPALKAKNINLASYPVGTGAYMMTENNPNKQIALVKNPNFHQSFFPNSDAKEDKEKGFLAHLGMQLPLIDRLIFKLEKESIPRWNKFLQGYYDKSGIGNSSFDQAIRLNQNGEPELTDELKQKGIRLQSSVAPTLFYLGFNMLDPVVGGYSEAKRKLRQAISIILNSEEYIDIFLNGRGIAAQGPIPPGVFGYLNKEKSYNFYIYDWINGKAVRKPIDEAKKLLSEAGYPGGKDPKTGSALILHYDATTSGNPGDKSLFDWYRKQFAKLGIQLDIRATLYNRFQDKIRKGKTQLFFFGWIADYPDPENFLFLLYGPNGKIRSGGENTTNYSNSEADQWFEKIRDLPNGSERQQAIDHWLAIVRNDSPMVWAFHPIDFVLSHQWVSRTKISEMIKNTSKYMQLDPHKRLTMIHQWNRPVIWVIVLLLSGLLSLLLILGIIYWKREHKLATPKESG